MFVLLNDNEKMSELSYAYLHAVAGRAGFELTVAGRHSDNAGIDATLRVKERFSPESTLTCFTIDVQLKATSQSRNMDGDAISFFVDGADRYNKLCDAETAAPLILVVLFLPSEMQDWLLIDAENLIARYAAYWTCLQGAPHTTNKRGQTVKLPTSQLLTVEELRTIAARVSRREVIGYEG